MIFEVVVLLVLILINGLLSGSEAALISLNDAKIRLMADAGNHRAIRIVKLLDEPTRFLATTQIGVTVSGFFVSALAATHIAGPFSKWLFLRQSLLPLDTLEFLVAFALILVLSFLVLLFGVRIPRGIAKHHGEVVAFRTYGFVAFVSYVFAPFVFCLTLSTNLILRLVGIDPNLNLDHATEEEIRMMVDVGEEMGSIHEHEKFMINNIFEFNNKSADEIMTHRMQLVMIPVDIGLYDLVALVEREKFTRFPIIDESVDHVIGILHVKDLIHYIGSCNPEAFSLNEIMRKPLFVPKTKNIDTLFIEMQKEKTHIAVVIDEYGGTAGIVTVEDMIEEIMGNIFDEYDEDEELLVRQVSPFAYEAKGLVSLSELEHLLDVSFNEEEIDTLSGFLVKQIGKIPKMEDIYDIVYDELRFKIIAVNERRIERVIIFVDSLSPLSK